MDNKTKAMLASYGRSFLAAVTTAFLIAGGDIFALDGDSFKAILAACISAVLPVALRAANPNDPAFGKVGKRAGHQPTPPIRMRGVPPP